MSMQICIIQPDFIFEMVLFWFIPVYKEDIWL